MKYMEFSHSRAEADTLTSGFYQQQEAPNDGACSFRCPPTLFLLHCISFLGDDKIAKKKNAA